MKLEEEPVIKRMAKELGLVKHRNAAEAIREFSVQRVERIVKSFGKISNLDLFLEVVSSGLGMKFEEIEDDNELQKLLERYIPQGEIVFADLPAQLDDKTDAVLIRLTWAKQWRYIAVIDCRGFKKWKAYFSKWHEVAHVLTMSPQATFQFRRTPAEKKDPEEQMVDRIAGDLAFYSPLFLPELLAKIQIDKRLTFDNIDDLRAMICPGASRESTIRAAIARSPMPNLVIIADYGMKKQEMRSINFCQEELFADANKIIPKLRATDVIGNTAATKSGLWIYRNIEVPKDSIITEAYNDDISSGISLFNIENLDWWKHSRGQLSPKPIEVEARKIGRRVFALIHQCKKDI